MLLLPGKKGKELKPKPNPIPKPKPKPNSTPTKQDHPTCCCNSKNQEDLVQDKICCGFSIPTGPPIIIYMTNISTNEHFSASGNIKNCSDTGILTVEFLCGNWTNPAVNGSVIRTVTIPPEGSFSFTFTHFDTIRAITNLPEGNMNAGEICITPRYRFKTE